MCQMADTPAIPSLDLRTLSGLYQAGDCTPTQLISSLLKSLAACPDEAVWISTLPRSKLLSQAQSVETRKAAGENLPLYGVPFAVKDSIDVAGQPTTAACPSYAYLPEVSSPVVQKMVDAGALFVGKTNLDQIGCGLMGDRSAFGDCRNVFDRTYISGGSSSGSAVAVAAGLVGFALGTDTAGSGRVPAGLNNIVGLKPAVGTLSTAGVVPSCPSLDCVSFLTLTVDDAQTVFDVARGAPPRAREAEANLASVFATPRDEELEFFGDAEQASLFFNAISDLEQSGARRIEVDFAPFREVANLLYEGPWLAERLAAVESFLKRNTPDVHPVTRAILEGGARFSAVDYFKALDALKPLREKCLAVFALAEVLVVPTMPTIPTAAAVHADSQAWSRRMGYYTNFANLLRLAALAVPTGFTLAGLPAGMTLLGPAGREERLCELGRAWQRLVNLPLGATGYTPPTIDGREFFPGKIAATVAGGRTVAEGHVRVAVAGAHLRGQPLHADLLRVGARFVRACRTGPHYRFLALMDLNPPRPGLLRDEDAAGSIEVEIYDLPMDGFGRLVASVAPPLSIGTIELADGESVKGFLCESWIAESAEEITEFGGWVAFRESSPVSTTAK
jgi:allophanate hydrolase